MAQKEKRLTGGCVMSEANASPGFAAGCMAVESAVTADHVFLEVGPNVPSAR